MTIKSGTLRLPADQAEALEAIAGVDIAAAVLGVPAELIADFNRIGLADSALAAPQRDFSAIRVSTMR